MINYKEYYKGRMDQKKGVIPPPNASQSYLCGYAHAIGPGAIPYDSAHS